MLKFNHDSPNINFTFFLFWMQAFFLQFKIKSKRIGMWVNFSLTFQNPIFKNA